MNPELARLLSPFTSAQRRRHDWQGESRLWWSTEVYSLYDPLPDRSAVYILAKRDDAGRASAVYIGQASDTVRRMKEHARGILHTAMLLGATEIHLHLDARTEAQRFAIETDLRNGHAAPLNRQPSRAATMGGLFGLLAGPRLA